MLPKGFPGDSDAVCNLINQFINTFNKNLYKDLRFIDNYDCPASSEKDA